MREILFRGKRIDNGEWCIGFYCQVADESDGGARVKHVIVVPTFKTQIGFLMYEVDPSTIEQYTGLTDKNDKKIFEGDIVKYYSSYSKKLTGESAVVCYGNFNCTCCKGVYGWSFGRHEEGDIRNHMNYVVIGNIHDNPELLEVNNEANMD